MTGILASRTKRVNINGNQGGGTKLQGLAPKATMFFVSSGRGGWGHFLRETFAPRRDWIFCMNQLSGVGAGRSMFKIRGLNHPDGARRCRPHPYRKMSHGSPNQRTVEEVVEEIIAFAVSAEYMTGTPGIGGGNSLRGSEKLEDWKFTTQILNSTWSLKNSVLGLIALVQLSDPGLFQDLDAYIEYLDGLDPLIWRQLFANGQQLEGETIWYVLEAQLKISDVLLNQIRSFFRENLSEAEIRQVRDLLYSSNTLQNMIGQTLVNFTFPRNVIEADILSAFEFGKKHDIDINVSAIASMINAPADIVVLLSNTKLRVAAGEHLDDEGNYNPPAAA